MQHNGGHFLFSSLLLTDLVAYICDYGVRIIPVIKADLDAVGRNAG